MKTDIYYFSGTGNSLTVAKKISNKIDHSEIISIPHVVSKSKPVTGEIIGIVCPIYFHNMPHIVADFIKKIKDTKYVFMVYAQPSVCMFICTLNELEPLAISSVRIMAASQPISFPPYSSGITVPKKPSSPIGFITSS